MGGEILEDSFLCLGFGIGLFFMGRAMLSLLTLGLDCYIHKLCEN